MTIEEEWEAGKTTPGASRARSRSLRRSQPLRYRLRCVFWNDCLSRFRFALLMASQHPSAPILSWLSHLYAGAPP